MKNFINIIIISSIILGGIILSPVSADNKEVIKKQVTVKRGQSKTTPTAEKQVDDKTQKINTKDKESQKENNKKTEKENLETPKTKDKEEITVKTDKKKTKKSEIPPVEEPNLKEDPKAVKMNADRLLYDDKTKISQLRGNVKIVYGDLIVKSKYDKFYGDKKEAYFTGDVKLYKPGNTVTGDKMDIFYNEGRGVIYENVRAVSYQNKDKKEPGKKKNSADDDAPLILTCKYAEYFWNDDEVYVDGNVKMWKNDKRAYADHGHYSQKIETVTLSDNVRFEQGAENWMTCPEAIFDLKSETFVANGGVTAEVEVEQQQNNKKKEDSSKNKKDDKKKKDKKPSAINEEENDNGEDLDKNKKKGDEELPEDRISIPKVFPQEEDEMIFTDELDL